MDRSVVPSNTFEQFRTEFNEHRSDVGDIASITSASGTIASATDVIEKNSALNTGVSAIDVDISGDTGTILLDNETLAVRTTNEIESFCNW